MMKKFFFLIWIYSAYAKIPLETISSEEAALLPKTLQMRWQREEGIFAFETQEKTGGFSLTLSGQKWEELPQSLRNKFQRTKSGYIFSYKATAEAPKANEEYCIAKRQVIEKSNPKIIQLQDLVDWIHNKKVLLYTGAGISAAAKVPTMHQLDALFPWDQNWIEYAMRHPRQIARRVRFFHHACFETSPTEAHFALKEIALKHNIPLLTENLDHLHQKSGIQPFCVTADAVRKQISPADLKEVDAILCIGLSYDDKGLLGWYKELNPKGKLISIDLKKPSYLENGDFLLLGDIQQVLPSLKVILCDLCGL